MNNQYIFHLGDHELISFQKNFDLLVKLPQAIRDQFINESEYWVQTKIQYQNLKAFLDYFFEKSSLPDINENNVADFYFLCDEFDKKDLKDRLNNQEFDVILKKAILNNILSNNINDTSFCSEYIAQNLDYYLNILEEEMYKVPIPILYNIFYNAKRNLTDQEKAYQFIKKRLINNNDNDDKSQKSICVLLGSLDASKISEESFKESILKQEERFGFAPKCNVSFITSFNQAIVQSQNQILNNFENYIQSILNQQQRSFTEFKNYFGHIIDNLSNKVQQISDENAESKKNVDDILTNVNSLMSNMQQNNIQLVSNVRDEVERKIRNLTTDINGIKTNVQQIFEKVNNSQSSIQQISSKIDTNFNQLSSKNDLEVIKTIIDQIKPKINSIQNNVQTTTTNVNSMKSNVDQITPKITQTLSRCEGLKTSIHNISNKTNEIKSNTDNLTSSIKGINDEIRKAKQKITDSSENEIEQFQKSINNVYNKILYRYHNMRFRTGKSLDIMYSSYINDIDIFKFYSLSIYNPFEKDDWTITGNSDSLYEDDLQNIWKDSDNEDWRSKDEDNSYIKIYFGEKKFKFQAVRITNHSGYGNYIDQLNVDVSNDDVNWDGKYTWVDLVSKNALTKPKCKYTLWASGAASSNYYKYIRIRMDKKNSSGNNILSLSRIELFGSLKL